MHATASREGWQLEANSAEAYERYLASAFAPWADQLLALAGVAPGDRVIDVACGTGIVARCAHPRVGGHGRVVGVDLNDAMLAVAADRSAALRPAIEWRRADAADLPFPNQAFDVACCEQAMQFFTAPVDALREIRRVLTPSGRVVASVCRPLGYSPVYTTLADALDRHIGPAAGAIMRSPFSTWTVADVRSLFGATGFEEVRIRIEAAALRYPSCEEFVRREAASSPLAGLLMAATADARGGLVRDLETALADHVDDDGIVCPLEAYVVLARGRRSG